MGPQGQAASPALVRLLGAAVTEVPVYGSGGFTTYDDARAAAQVEDWTGRLGIPRVKIKVGESWGRRPDRDLRRLRLVRDAVGPACELYADANGGYTVKQAVRTGRAFVDLGVTWFEEPVSSDDLPYFGRMVASGAVDCLQAGATRCGGITGWLRAGAASVPRGSGGRTRYPGWPSGARHVRVSSSFARWAHERYSG